MLFLAYNVIIIFNSCFRFMCFYSFPFMSGTFAAMKHYFLEILSSSMFRHITISTLLFSYISVSFFCTSITFLYFSSLFFTSGHFSKFCQHLPSEYLLKNLSGYLRSPFILFLIFFKFPLTVFMLDFQYRL